MRTPMKEIRKLLSDLTVDERLDLIKLLRTDAGISLEELLELRAEEEETACPSCGSHTIVKKCQYSWEDHEVQTKEVQTPHYG